jgi:hypothetical protein
MMFQHDLSGIITSSAHLCSYSITVFWKLWELSIWCFFYLNLFQCLDISCLLSISMHYLSYCMFCNLNFWKFMHVQTSSVFSYFC